MRRILYLSFALLLLAGRQAPAAQFWLADEDPVTQNDKHRDGPADYMAMFAPGAPWQQAESRLTAFKVSAQFILRGTDDMIRTVADDMHRHHIAFAVEMGAVAYVPGECGGGEGYAPPNLIDRVAGRLQRLGLTLDYWAMDSPLWSGHVRTWGRNDCAFPVEAVAERVARSVATMRRYFPNVVIGDIEALANRVPAPQLIADDVAFAQAFQRITGRPLAFMHWDVAWRAGGERLIRPFSRQMHALGIRVGVIIGGEPPDLDDETWIADGLRHARDLANDPVLGLDDFVVQSWQKLPTHMLPETDPGSATFELLQVEKLVR